MTKTCNKCGCEKPLTEFRKRSDGLLGRGPRCKECVRLADEQYKRENLERVRQSKRAYKDRIMREFADGKRVVAGSRRCPSCDQILTGDQFTIDMRRKDGLSVNCTKCKSKYDACYREKNADALREKHRAQWQKNKGKNSRKRRVYYQQNRESIIEKSSLWLRDPVNRERRKRTVSEWSKRRRREDPEFRLIENLRCRYRFEIRAEDRVFHSQELIGCSPAIARWFLEQQFHAHPETGEEMTWGNNTNYGWHVDHVVPLSSFDLRDPIQQKEAFHVSNLQPLWWRENLSKGRRRYASHSDGRYLLEQVMGGTLG